MPEASLFHSLSYEVSESSAVEDVIKSLEANSRLLKEAAGLLSELVPGLMIEARRVSIVELSQASPLKEVFALAVFLSFQKDLEDEVPKLVDMLTGIGVSGEYDTLTTVVVLIIVIYSISGIADRVFPKRDKKSLEKVRKSLLAKLASALRQPVESVRDRVAVWISTRKQKQVLSAAQRFFAPARGRGARITFKDGTEAFGADAVAIAQAVAGFPVEEDAQEKPATENTFLRSARIVLHAMDRDRRGKGWAGHIPDVFDDRVPMDLAKEINPESIFGRDEIIGDVLISSEEDKDGNMTPKSILLLQAYLQ